MGLASITYFKTPKQMIMSTQAENGYRVDEVFGKLKDLFLLINSQQSRRSGLLESAFSSDLCRKEFSKAFRLCHSEEDSANDALMHILTYVFDMTSCGGVFNQVTSCEKCQQSSTKELPRWDITLSVEVPVLITFLIQFLDKNCDKAVTFPIMLNWNSNKVLFELVINGFLIPTQIQYFIYSVNGINIDSAVELSTQLTIDKLFIIRERTYFDDKQAIIQTVEQNVDYYTDRTLPGLKANINEMQSDIQAFIAACFKPRADNLECETCKKVLEAKPPKTPSTTTVAINEYPSSIIVMVKLNTLQNMGISNNKTIIRASISFTEHVKLCNDNVYVLVAVTYHKGETTSSGHYFTFKKCADGLWWKFDDQSVTHVKQEDFFAGRMCSADCTPVIFYYNMKTVLEESDNENETVFSAKQNAAARSSSLRKPQPLLSVKPAVRISIYIVLAYLFCYILYAKDLSLKYISTS